MLSWWKQHAQRAGLAQTVVALHAEIPPLNALFLELGESRARAFLQRTLQRLGHCAAAHNGVISRLDTTSVLVLFAQADDALDAARAMQCELRAWAQPVADVLALHLHIGLSRGDVRGPLPQCEGPTIVRATALAAASQPGQILLDDAVEQTLPEAASAGLERVLCEDHGFGQTLAWLCPWDCAPAAAAAPACWLRIVQPASGAQQLFTLGMPLHIGRGEQAQVRVDHADVSRQHAQIAWRDTRCTLIDTSRNGTWLRCGDSGVVLRLQHTATALPAQGALYLGRQPQPQQPPDLLFELGAAAARQLP